MKPRYIRFNKFLSDKPQAQEQALEPIKQLRALKAEVKRVKRQRLLLATAFTSVCILLLIALYYANNHQPNSGNPTPRDRASHNQKH